MVKKLAHLLAGEVEKMTHLLARWLAKLKYWDAKLKNWHASGTVAHLLALWHVKMNSWHAFGTLTRDHVGIQTTLVRMARMACDLSNPLHLVNPP